MAGASAVGGDETDVLPVACALEFIHTYSLIHDDLPCMDDDDMRRGKPTSHKVFGEALALLAGDGLLTEAFTLLTSKELSHCAPADVILRVIGVIAGAAGIRGMVGGQAVDIQSEGRNVDQATVEYIHRHKTAALIRASVAAGALIGGGDVEQTKQIHTYGRNLGLAFQIRDDILDIEGDRQTMGKSVGSDARKQKVTYPSVVGLTEAKNIQTELVDEAIASLRGFDGRADPLRAIAQYIIERKR
jgi:geranylgeranyl diphosphate synthase type II